MLALVCGTGRLPATLAAACAQPPLICVLDGFAPDDLTADVSFRLEGLAEFFADLTARGVTEVCFAGAITRVAIDPTRVSAASYPLIEQLALAMRQGDDSALRVVLTLFEQAGFTVRAAQEVAPSVLASEAGILTRTQPSEQMQQDAEKGFALLAALSDFDTGQACVMGGGQLLGVETLGGTDHMLRSLPDAPQVSEGVVLKAPKRGQDPRVDWPSIGPKTIETLVSAGLAGLVVPVGGALIVDRAATIAAADAAGLCIWVRAEA